MISATVTYGETVVQGAIIVPRSVLPCVEPVPIQDVFCMELTRVEILGGNARLIFCVQVGEENMIVAKLIIPTDAMRTTIKALTGALKGAPYGMREN